LFFCEIRTHDLSETVTQPESGISLSPPFVLCLSISRKSVVATGTADGQLWIGRGGEKGLTIKTKKKERKKWEGLGDGKGLSIKIADGPVVAVYVIYVFLSYLTLLMN
jgi:hypothetical protein